MRMAVMAAAMGEGALAALQPAHTLLRLTLANLSSRRCGRRAVGFASVLDASG